ncbi:hypothetical protein V8D89_004189 [Ganoderma adspersum]
MDRVNATNVLGLLRNTPALEFLDIGSSGFVVPPNSTAIPSSVSLPRLQSSCLSRLASTVVSYLMTALEVPSLAYLDLSIVFATRRALPSTPLLPDALTTRTMRRLALDVESDFASFHAKLHGSGTSLKVDLSTFGIPDEERPQWAVAFRAMLPPLSAIEECHVQASQWAAPYDLLPHLATCMPMVSTLLIKHDLSDDDGDEEDVEGHMALARTVARVLESDSPVLFPQLTHLHLIVACIPRAFCKVLARALAHRAAASQRLEKLRIRIDDEYSFQWKLKWMEGRRKPDLRKTGIFDHVDVCEISDDFADDDDDPQRLGWGSWKDCVQRTSHEYWRG